MKELYTLVIKTIEEAEDLGIFKYHDLFNDVYVKDDPQYPSKKYLYYTNNQVSEEEYVLTFLFHFEDGSPDVKVNLSFFLATEKKTETPTKKWYQKTPKGGIILPTKSYPIYTVSAGLLKYEMTLEESRELHRVYKVLKEKEDNLKNKDEENKKKEQIKKIKDRLSGKIKVIK